MIFKNIKNAKNCLQIQLWDDDEEFLVLFLMYIFNAGWWVIQSIHVHVLQIDCTQGLTVRCVLESLDAFE